MQFGICLAPTARRHKEPGATPQGLVQRQIASAESAIHSYTDLGRIDGDPGALNRAFSAGPIRPIRILGRCPRLA